MKKSQFLYFFKDLTVLFISFPEIKTETEPDNISPFTLFVLDL